MKKVVKMRQQTQFHYFDILTGRTDVRIMRKRKNITYMETNFRTRATAGKLGVHKTDTVGKDDMRGRTRLSFQRQQEETG